MLKFGTISDVDAAKGLVRVKFDADDGIVSDWLPVIERKTLSEKTSWPMDGNEHVACLMDEYCEHGVVLGSIYSTADLPGITNKDQFGVKFANGDKIYYDRQSGELKINCGTTAITIKNNFVTVSVGTMLFKANAQTNKFDFTNGTVSLKQIINDLITAVTSMTQTVVGGGGGVTGLPVLNASQFALIQTQLSTLLT